jgi:hypothetical protein
MRIISNRAEKYNGGGYHYGSVWPLFTGWASVAEYRYHKPQAAYDNLRANALLALDGSPGHVTEVLSGDYYQPLSTSSPHQIWSAAMVISPLLRGMFGLQFDAQAHKLTFAPHVPADWKEFTIHHVAAGSDSVDLKFARTSDSVTLTAERKGEADVTLEFRPALSLRAKVLGVTLNGKSMPFRLEAHGADQHVVVNAGLSAGTNTLKISVRNDFAVTYSATLPRLGSSSKGLRILAETWSPAKDQLTMKLSALANQKYEIHVSDPDQIDRLDLSSGLHFRVLSSFEDRVLTFEVDPVSSEEHRNIELTFTLKPGSAVAKQKSN